MRNTSTESHEPRLSDVDIQIVDSGEDAIASARLVHDAYVAQGILRPHASGLYVTQTSASLASWSILARERGQPVGTMSLVVDSRSGLPMDRIYGAELQALRADGSRLAEVGGFAIIPAFRRSGLIYLMIDAIWRLARDLGADRFAIVVHPKGARFYRDVFGFEEMAAGGTYPGLTEEARAVALATPPGALIHDWPEILDACLRALPSGAATDLDLPGTAVDACSLRLDARRALFDARPDVFSARPARRSFTNEVAAS